MSKVVSAGRFAEGEGQRRLYAGEHILKGGREAQRASVDNRKDEFKSDHKVWIH